jgi:cytochrome c-type biogenesis protein CcmH
MKVVVLCLLIVSNDAELEKRLTAFSREIRCLVCQNETLADSRAGLAVDLRQQIREQMKAGRTDEEIKTFLTDRYGDFVLYRPPLKPATYALWFGPFILLAFGAFVLHRCVKHRTSFAEGPPLSAADRKRARKLLDGDGMATEANVAVYRDQLAEIELGLRNGTISEEEFQLDREELERRLLLDVTLNKKHAVEKAANPSAGANHPVR